MSSFWQFFDSQMAIFRRVRTSRLSRRKRGKLKIALFVGSFPGEFMVMATFQFQFCARVVRFRPKVGESGTKWDNTAKF